MTLDLREAVWRKSSWSGGSGGQCVEVALQVGGAAVRDSKNPDGGVLAFRPDQFARFIQTVKARAVSE